MATVNIDWSFMQSGSSFVRDYLMANYTCCSRTTSRLPASHWLL